MFKPLGPPRTIALSIITSLPRSFVQIGCGGETLYKVPPNKSGQKLHIFDSVPADNGAKANGSVE